MSPYNEDVAELKSMAYSAIVVVCYAGARWLDRWCRQAANRLEQIQDRHRLEDG